MAINRFPIPTVSADELIQQIAETSDTVTTLAGQVTLDREATTQARTAAAGFRDEAALIRDETQLIKTETETIAASGAVAARFYATIAAGRSAVADGETFGVLAGGSDGLTNPTIYRRDSSSTHTKVGELLLDATVASGARDDETPEGFPVVVDDNEGMIIVVSLDGVDFIPSTKLRGRIFGNVSTGDPSIRGTTVLSDQDNQSLMEIVPSGKQLAGGIDFVPSDQLKLRINRPPKDLMLPVGTFQAWRTDDGRLAVNRRTSNGLIDQLEEPTFQVKPIQVYYNPFKYRKPWVTPGTELELFLMTAQSLGNGGSLPLASQGGRDVDFGNEVLSYVWQWSNPDPATGFYDGICPDMSTNWGLAPAVGELADHLHVAFVQHINTNTNQRILPAHVIAASVNEYRALRGAHPRRTMIPFTIASPGYPIRYLDDVLDTVEDANDNLTHWNNLVYYLSRAITHANNHGYALRSRWHYFDHAQGDRHAVEGYYYPRLDTYLTKIGDLFQSYGLDRPRHIITQGGSFTYTDGHPWEMKFDQLRYCKEGKAILACPHYPWPTSDKIHPTGEGTIMYGECVSRAMATVDAGDPWSCLAPDLMLRETRKIVLQFDMNPGEALQFDSGSKYNAPRVVPYYGFEVVTISGGVETQIPISSVDITRRDTVVIQTSADIPAGAHVRYAFQKITLATANNYTDPYTCHAGRLRTDTAWKAKFNSAVTLHRWVPSFRFIV